MDGLEIRCFIEKDWTLQYPGYILLRNWSGKAGWTAPRLRV